MLSFLQIIGSLRWIVSPTRDYSLLVDVFQTSSRFPIQVPAKEQVKEISRALSWAQDNVKGYGGNPDKVHMMGHSSGKAHTE